MSPSPVSSPLPAGVPAEMTAISITTHGGPEVLVPGLRPTPVPAPGEVLVKVEAAGVNRPDVMQRKGLYPPPPGASEIPGLEIAGTIVALGADVTSLKVGERICALVTGGGYAEYCTAPAETALPIPEGLSAIEAAALPETVFTVWSNVFERGQLAKGEWLLVHGGSSGIGTTAIQLAKAFGAHVAVTAGSQEKCDACLKLGADLAINYREKDFVAEVKSATGGKGANVILDMIGGPYIQKNYEAAAVDGRIVQIAMQMGSKAEVDFMRVMLKRLTHTGSTLRSRPIAEKAALAAAITKNVWPLIAEGRFRPLIDSSYPLADAASAHAHMDSSAHIGKIVLTMS